MMTLGPRCVFGLLLAMLPAGCGGEPASPPAPVPAPATEPANPAASKDPVGSDRPIVPK
jgi:hypothetical protein